MVKQLEDDGEETAGGTLPATVTTSSRYEESKEEYKFAQLKKEDTQYSTINSDEV